MGEKLKKILIANRGEIAVRVIRACREVGIQSAAVFSDIDRTALHVRLAEEAFPIGKASPAESYLNIDRIIETAKKCRADAIHPGYGFLAENPEFVRRCEEEGIIFIGPQSQAMKIMGNKTASRAAMKKAGVPIVPGTTVPIAGEKDLLEAAVKIGFPLLLKAAAGGGGKGLRRVDEKNGLLSAFKMASSEAQSSFNDSSVYVEKYIEEPHHIEIQLIADNHGSTVYLGERECSIQRRFQKVLEETPSPFLEEKTRREMGLTAVRAARAVGYRTAGTVEFIVDKDKNFYFLEMNTRLQVEHPVTEMVSGIDLVKLQILAASGAELPFSQEDIHLHGASLQCRIYAEDPDNDFMPSPGKITHLRSPAGGLGVRDDSGVYEGYSVPLEYDPLISKLITWGETREEAVSRMCRALSEYQIYGIKTTISFFQRILRHPQFIAGNYNTHFISNLEDERTDGNKDKKIAALITAGLKSYADSRTGTAGPSRRPTGNWRLMGRINRFSKKL